MNAVLREAFDEEMQIAKNFYAKKNWKDCFTHLERAHVLGQRNAIPHTVNHWWMLKVGFKQNDWREIVGQILRLAVGGIGSLIGRAPIGNTGGSNVGILQHLPIPDDLALIFKKAGMTP